MALERIGRLSTNASQVVMRSFTKHTYPILTRVLSKDEVVFLNFAYEEDPPMAIPLAASDEPNRFFIQLYHRTAAQADLSGKQVLEVSCGHGGGASYIVRTFHPASYTGLDLNRRGIAFCRRTHNLPGLDFVQGDACNLPFPDRSFDAVVNVEASQLYSSFPRFLAEVERVLRPGGHFLYTDFRWVPLIDEWEQDLANAPMRQLSYDNINAEVVRGLDKTMQWRQDLIDRHLPAVLRRRVERFGVPGPRARDALRTGHYKYLMCSFVKA
jgi:fatty-acid O-methyltransferase